MKVYFVLEPVTSPPEGTCSFCSLSTLKSTNLGDAGWGKHCIVSGRPKAAQMLVLCSLELVTSFAQGPLQQAW